MSKIQINQEYSRKANDKYSVKLSGAYIHCDYDGKFSAKVDFEITGVDTGEVLERLSVEVLPEEWNTFWAAVKQNGVRALFQTLKTKYSEVVPGTIPDIDDRNS